MILNSRMNAHQERLNQADNNASNYSECELVRFAFLNRLTFSAIILTLIVAILDMTAVEASEIQTQTEIRNSVKEFLEHQMALTNHNDITIYVDRLDSRLKLQRCKEALDAFLPSSQALLDNVTVGIRCQNPKPWVIYVPAKVTIFERVIATAKPLLRGQKITASDLVTVRKKISKRDRAFFRNKSDVVNLIVKRNMPAGKVVTPPLVQAPRLVERGTEVILIAETEELVVRMSGKALSDGARGELVQVRNSATNRIVEGIVTKRGTVKVKM